MIKLVRSLFVTLSIISFLEGHTASIAWDNKDVQEAIWDMNNMLKDSFQDSDWSEFKFQEQSGESAVKFLLNEAKAINEWRNMKCIPGYENIFSLLGFALLDKYIEEENRLERAAIWIVRGLITARKFHVWASLAETFLRYTLKPPLPLEELREESPDADIEAAIKALHEKLVEEAEAEEKDTSD